MVVSVRVPSMGQIELFHQVTLTAWISLTLSLHLSLLSRLKACVTLNIFFSRFNLLINFFLSGRILCVNYDAVKESGRFEELTMKSEINQMFSLQFHINLDNTC